MIVQTSPCEGDVQRVHLFQMRFLCVMPVQAKLPGNTSQCGFQTLLNFSS